MTKSIKALAILGVVAGLGVATLPLSSYAATENTNMGVKTTIEDFISIETETDGSADNKYVVVEGVVNNGAAKEGVGTFTVKTNNESGYYVQISADNLNLVGENNTEDVPHLIPAGVPAKGESKWGYKVSSEASNVTVKDAAKNYAGVTASGVTIATGTGATDNNGDNILITFGISADAHQAADTYKGLVKLVATTGAEPEA